MLGIERGLDCLAAQLMAKSQHLALDQEKTLTHAIGQLILGGMHDRFDERELHLSGDDGNEVEHVAGFRGQLRRPGQNRVSDRRGPLLDPGNDHLSDEERVPSGEGKHCIEGEIGVIDQGGDRRCREGLEMHTDQILRRELADHRPEGMIEIDLTIAIREKEHRVGFERSGGRGT